MGKLNGVEHDVGVVFEKVSSGQYRGTYTITKPGLLINNKNINVKCSFNKYGWH